MSQTHEPNRCGDGHRTLRAVSSGALLRLLRYPFVMLSMVFIPNRMGDALYGEYAYYMAVFLVLDIFSDVGVMQIFGRFIPECLALDDRARARNILHGTITFGLVQRFILIAVIAGINAFGAIPHFRSEWLVILGLQLLFTHIEGTLFSFVYSLNQIERYSLKEIYRSAFTFVFVLGGYYLFGLMGALWGLVLNSAVLSAIATCWTWKFLAEKPVTVTWRFFWPYLLFGIQFYIPSFFFGMLQRSGNVFVRQLTGTSEQVAYYDVANQFLMLLSQLLALTLTTLIPSLTHLQALNDEKRIDQWQGKALSYCMLLALLSFNLIAWLGDFAVQAVFGADYAPVYPNAIISALAMIPILLAGVGMNYALLKKQPGIYTKGVAIALVVMAGGCLALIPRYDALGASWATFAGYLALAFIFMGVYRRHFAVMLRQMAHVIGPLLLLAPSFLIKRLDSWPIDAAGFLLTTAAYLALLWRFRVISRDDIGHVLHAFGKKEAHPPRP